MKETITLPGCRIHLIETDQFKTTILSIKFKNQLTRETTTIRSLLSMVLLGGTAKLPSTKELAIYLEKMYGASLSSHVSTKGSAQIIHLTSTFVNEQYLIQAEPLFEKQVQLMKDILYAPLLIDGCFKDEIVNMKKRELKERLAALKDDKYTYALDQTLDAMGKDQILGISGIGYEKDVDQITKNDLTHAFQKMLLEDTIEIYAVGHFTSKNKAWLQEAFSFSRRSPDFSAAYCFQSKRQSVLRLEEIQDITQAKLNLGFCTQVDFLSPHHAALTVFNGLFGGFSHSRLFKNVREKHSLCYYIASSCDAFNGILLVSCGIEANQAKEAERLILTELKSLQNGEISDEELNMTKKMFENSLRKANDEPASLINLAYNRDIVCKDETVEQYLKRLLAVSKEEICQVAKNITLDTVYLLRGEEV